MKNTTTKKTFQEVMNEYKALSPMMQQLVRKTAVLISTTATEDSMRSSVMALTLSELELSKDLLYIVRTIKQHTT